MTVRPADERYSAVSRIETCRHSVAAAIADLVDNSIMTQARHIDPVWDGRESWVAVVDDGSGMTDADLITAMTITVKGPRADRGGLTSRFGMGLTVTSG